MNAQLESGNTGMQVTTFENPMGIDGFEFVEFASPEPAKLHAYFKHMGFTAVLRHRKRPITVYRQGTVNFLINEDPDSFAADFAKAHGPCACGFAIRVSMPADEVCSRVIANGGEAIDHKVASKAVNAPVVKGIGDCMLYLVDKYGDAGDIYAADFEPIEGADPNPVGFGLTFIDHLTHNLYFGNMQKWSDYYERLFNFREIRYFDIKGAKTGLVSKAMTAPDGMVRIPLNESSDEKSQINEYLDEYRGEGIQHIACFTDDIYSTIEAMRAEGIEFLDTPNTYYELIDERIPHHGEDVARMWKNRILIDADAETKKKLLLQIFTKNCIGPIFFEIIQRKGNPGFGEGNFQALFESIERDQMKRGVL
ncbi:4-hydroxyphenylpyruvate dioxygenase [Dokdonella sp.]|uniref:4-hydroxyphenylpyruvate dioxygenase n=1 Tax=Dokdonella sp. TaxID=2291710 RepID=UPI003527E82C